MEQNNQLPQQKKQQTLIIQQNRPQSNGAGTAGFVLALIALLIGWIPFIGWVVGGVIWLLGLIFSFAGIFKRPKGLAIAGLVISLIGFIILFIIGGALAAIGASSH